MRERPSLPLRLATILLDVLVENTFAETHLIVRRIVFCSNQCSRLRDAMFFPALLVVQTLLPACCVVPRTPSLSGSLVSVGDVFMGLLVPFSQGGQTVRL